MAVIPSSSAVVQTRKQLFEREKRIQRIKMTVSGILAVIGTLFLIVLFGGAPFQRTREALGLSRFLADERGVYTRCKPATLNRFCGEGGVDTRTGRGGRTRSQPVSEPNFIPFSLSSSGQ